MIKLTVSNQRGGVGKTTTAFTLARCWADDGKRVLLVDTDAQGSIWLVLQLVEFQLNMPRNIELSQRVV